MNGWFAFEREFVDHPFFDNSKIVKLWLWCKARACFKSQQVTIGRTTIFLEIGQFLFGRKAASEKLKIPETTLRDYLKLLESAGFFTIKTTHSYSIITITYKPGNISSPPGFPPSNGQQMDTYKNVNNENNKYLPPDKRLHPNKNRNEGKSPYRERYQFDPWVGTYSAVRPTEEEKIYLPKIDEEYRTMLAEYMKREGITNEEKIDNFKFPSLTDFRMQRLAEIRKR